MKSERGAVALITTIIISLMLLIITTGIVAAMSSELRQQTDDEQSQIAYFGAQSGVEDAISKVKSAVTSHSALVDQPCQAGDFTSVGGFTIGWTCQKINYTSNPTGSIPNADQHVQVDAGAASVGSVGIFWDKTSTLFGAPAPGGAPIASWPYAAPLEVTIIEYPRTAFNANTPGNLVQKNVLFYPAVGGIGSNVNFGALGATGGGGNPVYGNCAVGSTYHCSSSINNLNPAKNYIFVLRTRYVGTDYNMVFNGAPVFSLANPNVLVDDGAAYIDVTAKSSAAYRRVLYKVPYTEGVVQGLDYVIYSDTNVCKDFTVISGAITGSCP